MRASVGRRRFAWVARKWMLPPLAAAALFSCVARKPEVASVVDPDVPGVIQPEEEPGWWAESPAKAHMVDGTTVVYADGFRIDGDTVRGAGMRWNLALTSSTRVEAIPLDSLAAMETFGSDVKTGTTITLTSLAVIGGAAAVGAVAIAIYCASNPKCFGSCPTVYSDSAGRPVLEAETFPYAIAPSLEAPDVDVLRAQPGADGLLRLEVRNEALETHYMNRLTAVEVTHEPDEFVVPDPQGSPLVLSDVSPPMRATDRADADRRAELRDQDGLAFRTDSATLTSALSGDLRDHLDLEFTVPSDADSVALFLRFRNSLLITVLLYDMMLGDRGIRAIDWIAGDLEDPWTQMDLRLWAGAQLGSRVEVWDGSTYRTVGRIPDTGPVAWKDVAVVIPALTRPDLKVRLSFVADSRHIDLLGVARRWRRPESREMPLSRVEGSDGVVDSAAQVSLAEIDEHYLKTSAGERYSAVFDAGASGSDDPRTYLLRSHGYYVEWIRRAWLERGRDKTAFRPDRAAIREALQRWIVSRDSTESLFYATRVPVQ